MMQVLEDSNETWVIGFDRKLESVERCFLQDFHKRAILAGGAPRDMFFGKEVTDYDFYVQDADGVVRDLQDLGFSYKRTGGEPNGRYDDPNIVTVLSSKNFDVVVTKGLPQEHIYNFSTSLSMIYTEFDGKGEVTRPVMLSGFREGLEDQVAWVSMDAWLNPHFFKTYIKKIHKKYPNWVFQLQWNK